MDLDEATRISARFVNEIVMDEQEKGASKETLLYSAVIATFAMLSKSDPQVQAQAHLQIMKLLMDSINDGCRTQAG